MVGLSSFTIWSAMLSDKDWTILNMFQHGFNAIFVIFGWLLDALCHLRDNSNDPDHFISLDRSWFLLDVMATFPSLLTALLQNFISVDLWNFKLSWLEKIVSFIKPMNCKLHATWMCTYISRTHVLMVNYGLLTQSRIVALIHFREDFWRLLALLASPGRASWGLGFGFADLHVWKAMRLAHCGFIAICTLLAALLGRQLFWLTLSPLIRAPRCTARNERLKHCKAKHLCKAFLQRNFISKKKRHFYLLFFSTFFSRLYVSLTMLRKMEALKHVLRGVLVCHS